MKFTKRQSIHNRIPWDPTITLDPDGVIQITPPGGRVQINGTVITTGDAAGPVVTNVLYVTQDGDDTNSGEGESSTQAKRTLKAALAVAQEGTTIYVRSGTYYEDNPLRVPPRVAIVGDNLRTTIIRPLNGPETKNITFVSRSNNYITVTTSTDHGFSAGDRVRMSASVSYVSGGSFIAGQRYRIVSVGSTVWTNIGASSNTSGVEFVATGSGSGSGTAEIIDVNLEAANITEVTSNTFTYYKLGADFSTRAATGTAKKGYDIFHVNSGNFITGLVFKGLASPGYCIAIDSNAMVDTSPYVQNCSNINGPWMKNGTEWIPFQTEQPDINGNMVTGPRPLLDHEIINDGSRDVYGIDEQGAGGGMLIDGDKYHTQSPIKSMVGDAFTQVAQGGIGFHITNFGYMQLVSCFSVFCDKAFYTTNGGYLSISNSVCDFGNYGMVADGYYPIPYATGEIRQNYYSNVGSITVNTSGSGYTGNPTVTIDPPSTPGGVTATATASIDPILGIVNAISITSNGSGYTSTPNVTISGGGASVNATATANLSKNLTVNVDYLPNKPQVGSIVFFTGDSTAYYVTDTSSPSFTLRYDEQKCRRDVGLILEAVLGDMVFNTNYQSAVAGLSYLRSYSSKVISQQKAETIAGINKARDLALALTANATAQARITSNFGIITDLINLGVGSLPALSYPNVGSANGFTRARDVLIQNKQFFKDEIVAWIANNYPLLSYNVATCQRDIGYIIDALAYDITYGGNSATVIAANSYLDGSVIAGEVEETQNAYEYWKTIVAQIVQNQAITSSPGNGTPQDTSLPAGSGDAGVVLQNLLQIIIDVLDHGPGYVPETSTYATFSAGNATLNAERLSILTSKAQIQNDVINFLNDSTIAPTNSTAVTLFPAVTTVNEGAEALFHNVSTVSTGATILEYVGAGVTYNALPFFGGEPEPLQETDEQNNGKVFFVTSDQVGNYNIGPYFTVNALTGEVTIDAEELNLSGLASIGPFKRNGIPVGVELREVSDNANLISSLGTQDNYTVPTQNAVSTYVENRYLNKVNNVAQTVVSDITFNGDVDVDLTLNVDGNTTLQSDLAVNGGDLTTTSATFNLINANATTVNFAGAATTLEIGAGTGTTNINNNLDVDGNTLINGNLSVDGSATITGLITGDVKGSIFADDSSVMVDAVDENFYGENITLNGDAAINGGDLTTSAATFNLINANATTVNFAGAATGINIGAAGGSGTVNVKNDNVVLDGDLQVKGGDLTTNQVTFNLLNTTATTVNFANDAVALTMAATTGTTVIRNSLQVDFDLAVNGGDLTTNQTTFNLANTSATTVNAFGAATSIEIGAGTGTTNINHSLDVDGNLLVNGNAVIDGNLTVGGLITADIKGSVFADDSSVMVDAVDENFYGENITLNGDAAINGGDITTSAATFNLINANATTVNFAGAATSLVIAAATGTTNIRNSLDVDLDTTFGDVSRANTHTTYGQNVFHIRDNTLGSWQILEDTGTAVNYIKIDSNNSLEQITIGDNGTQTLKVAFANSLDATNATTGPVTFAGGVGIAKKLFVGTDLQVAGNATIGDSDLDTQVINGSTTVNVLDNSSAAFVVQAGLEKYIEVVTTNGSEVINLANTIPNANVKVLGTTNATNKTTGALQVTNGGLAVALDAWIGQDLMVEGNAVVQGDLQIQGGDLTVNIDPSTSFNLVNTLATVINFGGAATTIEIGAASGTTNINHNLDVDGDINIDGGDLTVSTLTFNLANANATTVNAFGAATTLNIGAASGTTNIKNDLDVDGDVNIDGGDLTVSTATFNLANTNATTVNAFGAATTLELGAATGTTNVNNNLDVDGDVNIDGNDLTTSSLTFNLLNTNATTVNAFGAATTVEIGAGSGTTNINNNLDVDGDVNIDGGDLTVSTATFNLANTNATTVNFAGAATTLEIGAPTGTTNINNNLDVDGDINIDGGDITTSQATFNLINTNATTVNFAGAATTLEIGAGTGTTNVNNNLDVDGDVNIDGGDLTASTSSFNLLNTTVTTLNIGGQATAISLGASTGITNINHSVDIDGDLQVDGGDITTNAATFNLVNSNATTVNAFAAATTVNLGASGSAGTLTIKNDNVVLDGDLQVKGGDLTTNQTTFNLVNTTATTVNFAGAATTLEIGAASGTTNINNDLDVDGDINIDGGDLTVSTATFNLVNTNATTVNFAGAATTLNLASASGTTTVKNSLQVDGNLSVTGITTSDLKGSVFSLDSTYQFIDAHSGDLTGKNLLLDQDLSVNGGDINTNQSTFNLINANANTVNFAGASNLLRIASNSLVSNTTYLGPQVTGNVLNLRSTTNGTVNLVSDSITGIINLFDTVTTGTVNLATAGASTINIGGVGSNVNIKELRLTTDLEVQYGGTGVSSFTNKGIIYGNGSNALQVTAAWDVTGNTNATTSYGILTTDATGVPLWTDEIDGGTY